MTLRRRTPLRRTRFGRSSRKSKYKLRIRHTDHMMAVKKLPCCARHLGTCGGPIEVDHVGPRGMSQKSDDRLVISICRQHHVDRTNFCGVFRSYDQRSMREFVARALVETQLRLLRLGLVSFPTPQPSTP